MPPVMTLSGSSSTFRFDRRALPADPVVAVFALLAAIALGLSGAPPAPAAAIWLAAALACLIERRLRRTAPRAFELQPPSALRIEWEDGRSEDAVLRRWRQLGPLLLIELAGGRHRQQAHWLPGSSMNERRRLLRQLARMRPVAADSV